MTVIGNKAYIFGGERAQGELCSTDIHAVTLPSNTTATDPETLSSESKNTDYACYPAFPLQDAETGKSYVPAPRSRHAACARGKYVVVHGGCDSDGKPISEEEGNCLWLFDTESLQWTRLRGETQIGATLAPRYGHHIFVDKTQDILILHGGITTADGGNTQASKEAWLYDFNSKSWTSLPSAPSAPLAAAYAGDSTLYTISRDNDGADESTTAKQLSGQIHYLPLLSSTAEREKPGAITWHTVTYPINPLTPGPVPRAGNAALLPLETGHGRTYLVYMFGCNNDANAANSEPSSPDDGSYYSDIWTLQIPSHKRTAAAAKDAIRDKIPGLDSNTFSWAEAEIIPVEQVGTTAAAEGGKVHPGPRGFFGSASLADGKGVVIWGGLNPKGEREGDGWLLRTAYGLADWDRKE